MLFSIYTSLLPSWLLFVFLVGGIVGFACFVLMLRRRNAKWSDSEEEDKLIQSAITYIGSVYGVLLALMILSAQGKFDTVDSVVTTEAAAITAAARDASTLPEPLRGQVLDQLRQYTGLILSDDWAVMSTHYDNPKPLRGSKVLNNLWVTYGTKISKAPLGSALISDLNVISVQRNQRFALARQGLPDSFWGLLGVGIIVMIYLTTSLRIKSPRHHFLILICLVAPLAILLWLVADMDNPFGGTLQISRSVFIHALQVLDALPR